MPPVSLFVALADPTRCRIVELLRSGPQPVHLLAGSFAISRPAISRHLRVLKAAKLISERKTGRENLYALHRSRLKPAAKWLENMQAAPAAVRRVAEKGPSPAPSAPVKQMGFEF